MTNKKQDIDRVYWGLMLYKARTAMNLTQTQLAEAIGVSDRIIYDYESGSKLPSPTNLVKIALYLKMSLDDTLRLKG